MIYPRRSFVRDCLRKTIALLSIYGVLVSIASGQNVTPLQLEMPKSRNPLRAYTPERVPEPILANSPRLDRLVRDGKLYLSLKDAIDSGARKQSRSRHCSLQFAYSEYRYPSHPSRRKLSRCQHRRRPGNSRWWRRRLRNRSARRGSRWNNERGRRCWSRSFWPGRVYSRNWNAGFFL